MAERITLDDFPRMMIELRAMAQGLLKLEGSAQSLTPTALVQTALLRQFPAGKGWEEVTWRNRSYFLGAMYQAMRRALIDHAKARNAKKRRAIRPMQVEDLVLDNLVAKSQDHPEQVEAAMQALERLRTQHPEWAELVEHRFFAGYSIEATARVMDKAEKTIRRWWDQTRVILHDEVLRILNEEDIEVAP